MLWLDGSDLERLLDAPSCIEAVEAAFRTRGAGGRATSVAAGLELPEGVLHAKLATLDLARSYAVAKLNANVPTNPDARGLPTIQGVLALFDASIGTPLAVMDSAFITAARTAATTAVAARYLACEDASVVSLIGCGAQAAAHLGALRSVREIDRVFAFDVDRAKAQRFVEESVATYGIEVLVAPTLRQAVRESTIVVTLTSARRAILFLEDVAPGTFIAAVGADHARKQEIDVALMAAAMVVVDDLDQCARDGDLHHAIEAGVMSASTVHASLEDVITGAVHGRATAGDIIVFDSTGIAIEDAAVAALAYERSVDVQTTTHRRSASGDG
jgi:alanine dehydrogenase